VHTFICRHTYIYAYMYIYIQMARQVLEYMEWHARHWRKVHHKPRKCQGQVHEWRSDQPNDSIWNWFAQIHVTNESCHAYKWVMLHEYLSHVTLIKETCHVYEWVTSHMWISHVTHMNESCYTSEWVISHTWTDALVRICIYTIQIHIYILIYT